MSTTARLHRREETMSTNTTPITASRPNREITLAWAFFVGTIVAFVLSGVWSIVVGTASPGANEKDLVQGWEGVARNLPGYLLAVAVGSLGVWFATQAGVHGSQRSRSALIATSLVFLFALSSVTRDGAEVVMTTRAATVSWITFVIDALAVAIVFIAARQRISRA
mgnify:FL=1